MVKLAIMSESQEIITNPHRVFVLGAGFSKEITDPMPLADDLGERISKTLEIPESLVRGKFEDWLSRLAEAQPDVEDSENLRRRSYFATAVGAIATELEGIERTVVVSDDGFPVWLTRFIRVVHFWQSTLISFNYDTLIELAVARAAIPTKVPGTPLPKTISAGDVVGQMPQLPFGQSRAPFATLRLWKLHGSLAWWWVPNDKTGMTIARWPLDDEEVRSTTFFEESDLLGNGVSSRRAEPDEEESERIKRLLPNRSRFIAPPLGAKSEYFQNPFMIQLWRNAREALDQASAIYFVGYSLPQADTSARGLFREAIPRSTKVFVVNPHPRQIVSQLRGWGFSNIRTISGNDCVEKMVDKLESERAREIVGDLKELASSHKVSFVNTNGNRQAGLVKEGSSQLFFDRIENGSLVLCLSDPNKKGMQEAVSEAVEGNTSSVSVEDFFSYLDRRVKEIKLIDNDNRTQRVISFELSKEEIQDKGRFTLREIWLQPPFLGGVPGPAKSSEVVIGQQ